MKAYVDANAWVRLYLQLPGHPEILALITGKESRSSWPLPITALLRLEVINGIHRMVFESRSGGQWRVPPESAAAGLAEFAEHLRDGELIRHVPLSPADLEPEFTSLADRHTAKHGFRTYDILHVASAVKLGCGRFLSLDSKANTLARLANLKTI